MKESHDMTKRLGIAIALLIIGFFSYANDISTTFSPIKYVEAKNYKQGLARVVFDDYFIAVTIEVVPKKDLKELYYFTGPNCHVLIGNEKHPLIGILGPNNEFKRCLYEDGWGVQNAKKGRAYQYTLVFSGRPLSGVTDFSLVDNTGTSHGPSFFHYKISNPLQPGGNLSISQAETQIKSWIDIDPDEITGIYESVNSDGTRLGIFRSENIYGFFYLGDKQNTTWWHPNEIKARAEKTAVPGMLMGQWVKRDKQVDNGCKFLFDGVAFQCQRPHTTETFVKVYPLTAQSNPSTPKNGNVWTGTGWSILDNYIVTNYHVVDGAKTIFVKGINGDKNRSCSATIVASDKNNDLAILKLSNVSISNIPYAVSSNLADVGEEVFVLGYPMTDTMGDEIKLTTGVISSLSGFQGDVANYQISVPIQPGNSGGPMFDQNGNVIGIVVAKHNGAELVSYAIKTSYLQNLMLSSLGRNIFPKNNRISTLPLTGKVKEARKYVYYIMCSDTPNFKF